MCNRKGKGLVLFDVECKERWKSQESNENFMNRWYWTNLPNLGSKFINGPKKLFTSAERILSRFLLTLIFQHKFICH